MSINDLCATDVGTGVMFGKGTKTWQYSTVCDGVITGERCVIGSCAWVGKGVRMGDDCRLQHGVFLPNYTVLGNRVFIGPNVTFTDDRYPTVNNQAYNAQPPVVEDDAAIGAGAIILAGVRIGRGALVGAGAVVTGDVPAGATVIGVPARAIPSPTIDERT